MGREFKSIEVNRVQALTLREKVLPFANLTHASISTGQIEEFCKRVYIALIKLESPHHEHINLPLSADECFLINQFVSVEDNEDAAALLRQTWCVIYEYEYGYPPSVASDIETILSGLDIDNDKETRDAQRAEQQLQD